MENPANTLCDIPVRCAYDEVADVVNLVPHPRNPNKHPDEQIALLAKVIRHQGWRSPIVVSARSGFIVAGHGRLEAAKLLGVQSVPVDRQEFANEADEMAHLLADNRIAELADMDAALVADLLAELRDGGMDLELGGFTDDEFSDLAERLAAATDGATDAEPQIDRADELNAEWQVAPGDLWQIGRHRLLCGDSTKPDNVERLLAGKAPRLMVTDPPYGVEYDAEWRNQVIRADGSRVAARATGKVLNDDRADWTDAWKHFPGDVAYIWHAGRNAAEVQRSIEEAQFEIRAQIIWAKQQFAIGRGDYHWKHEPCWYAVRKGRAAKFKGDRTQTTLWEIDKPQKSETGHSTQKPLECMARAIRNHSGDIYEPFAGSGTTLVAAENLGRACYAIELHPPYCAVILDRMRTAFPRIEIHRITEG